MFELAKKHLFNYSIDFNNCEFGKMLLKSSYYKDYNDFTNFSEYDEK